MKFKCTSCQHVFEHEADKNECFCPKCGNISTLCNGEKEEEEEPSAVCSECGTVIPSGSTSCPVCGCPVSATQHRHCEECGAEVPDSAQVCPQCGCPVPAAPPQPVVSVSASDNRIPEADSPHNMDESPYCDDTATDDKKKYYIIGGAVLAAALLGLILWYFFSDKFKSNSSDPTKQYTVVAENLFFRSSPSANSDDNLISKIPYGTSVTMISSENQDWSEVEFNGEKGYVGSRYIMPDSIFFWLDRVWESPDIRTTVDQNRCRLAILDYINRRQLSTGDEEWQISYAGQKGSRPNTVMWPELRNGYDRFPEFAFMLRNKQTGEGRIAIYSFDATSEKPINIYDEPVEYDGMINDIRLDRRGNLQVSFTGNLIDAPYEEEDDLGCATYDELYQEETTREPVEIPEEILNSIKTTEIQTISAQEEETIEPEVDQSKTYHSVDVAPKFPGGDAAMMRWISEHLRYPAMAQENNIQGRVVVQFVVTKTGKVGDVKIIRSRDPDLDREAVRVVRTLPDFTPGTIKGVPVDAWYTLPLTFRLS